MAAPLDLLPSSGPPGSVPTLGRNSYVTDGRRLFRCLLADRRSLLIFEDCLTFELSIWPLGDLAELGVRLVKVSA